MLKGLCVCVLLRLPTFLTLLFSPDFPLPVFFSHLSHCRDLDEDRTWMPCPPWPSQSEAWKQTFLRATNVPSTRTGEAKLQLPNREGISFILRCKGLISGPFNSVLGQTGGGKVSQGTRSSKQEAP